jgi:DNA/RNA-binding domain of Phe-tRNA-synthetase-like protein
MSDRYQLQGVVVLWGHRQTVRTVVWNPQQRCLIVAAAAEVVVVGLVDSESSATVGSIAQSACIANLRF